MKKQSKKAVLSFWLLILVALIGFFIYKFYKEIPVQDDVNALVSSENNSSTYINGCYYRSGNEIYCGSNKQDILPNVDLDTFEVLSYFLATDKDHVYVKNKVNSEMDRNTFEKYSKKGLNLRDLYTDKNGIYIFSYENKLEPLSIDISTAENIDQLFIRDKNGVYFYSDGSIKRVKEADPETFRILGTCASVERSYSEYVADKNHVYVGDQIIPDINPSYFIKVASIESAEGEIPYTFYLWKDNQHVYVYCWTVIKEADYATFEYKDGRAQDKNNYYEFNTGGGHYNVIPRNRTSE